ncbi:MAG: hypothetical protein U1E45_25025 [Geminicoccaceae bacterium]
MPDGNVIPFRSKQQQRLERTADEVIALLGAEASLRVRHLARSTDPESRARLLALAELIEEKQGFGWLLAEDLADEAS